MALISECESVCAYCLIDNSLSQREQIKGFKMQCDRLPKTKINIRRRTAAAATTTTTTTIIIIIKTDVRSNVVRLHQ